MLQKTVQSVPFTLLPPMVTSCATVGQYQTSSGLLLCKCSMSLLVCKPLPVLLPRPGTPLLDDSLHDGRISFGSLGPSRASRGGVFPTTPPSPGGSDPLLEGLSTETPAPTAPPPACIRVGDLWLTSSGASVSCQAHSRCSINVCRLSGYKHRASPQQPGCKPRAPSSGSLCLLHPSSLPRLSGWIRRKGVAPASHLWAGDGASERDFPYHLQPRGHQAQRGPHDVGQHQRGQCH